MNENDATDVLDQISFENPEGSNQLVTQPIKVGSYFRESSLSKHDPSNYIVRSSRPEVFCKKNVLKNFAKFTGERLGQSLFFNKKETLAQAFSCEFCEIFKKLMFFLLYGIANFLWASSFTLALL